ncbi:aspartate kinase [Pseudonocardia sp. N23]|uniref:aspartate kinase n=1 Tax=Pseudonocardia sp. N23 TaxID=1987376 RepID=UPI000C03880F|nr:aspartate kinase [Pseudonocardia sp. N23]GAY10466.1 aspartokinase [Pseudonocardia sp. N23]
MAGRRSGKPAPRSISGPQAPLVWKFGGTSVGDQERVLAVAERMVAAQRSGRGVVAVLSAMGKSTDALVAQAAAISPNPPLRELDALLSVGEQISCALTAMAIASLGGHAVSLTGAQAGIRTDATHGSARMLGIDPARIRKALDDGAIVLVTGFQGESSDGDTTTLGRGGSDASAVAVAAALGARECEIFTDVPAVYTADPRVVPDARRLATIRPQEMLELAEAGAGVLQPRSVELAMAHGVDIHLRSSFGTEEGTWIRGGAGDFEVAGTATVAGVAHRRDEHLYSVDAPVTAVAAALAGRGLALGAVVPGAGTVVAVTVPGADPAAVAAALDAAAITLLGREDLGSVGVVSLGLARAPEVPASTLDVLAAAGITPRLVTTTPSRVGVLVAADRVDDAVRALHAALVGGESAGAGATAA